MRSRRAVTLFRWAAFPRRRVRADRNETAPVRALTALALALLASVAARPAHAGGRLYTTSKTVAPFWPDKDGDGRPDPVMYNINLDNITENVAGPDPLNGWQAAIAASFEAGQNVPTASIELFRGPNTTKVNGFALDGVNPIAFLPVGIPIGVLAITLPLSEAGTGEIGEASMLFNPIPLGYDAPKPQYSTDGSFGSLDIQAIATHEAGHYIGLCHSAVRNDADDENPRPAEQAVMYPYIGHDVLAGRELKQDDIAWVSNVYPEPSEATTFGGIVGRIVVGSAPLGLYGARGTHVVARERATNRMVVGTYSRPELGVYRIPGLPPGDYNVWVEALDGPVSSLQVSALTQFTHFGSFPADYFSGDAESGTEPNPNDVATAVPVTVVAGGTRSFTDIVLDDSVPVCGRIPRDVLRGSGAGAGAAALAWLVALALPIVVVGQLRERRWRPSASGDQIEPARPPI